MPFADISEDRPALLVISSPAWEAVREQLRGFRRISAVVEATAATTDRWDTLLFAVSTKPVAVVYAVGGGLTADAGKYMAAQLGLPLVVLPTALSVDAFLTAASGIRKDGCVRYIDTKVADDLILDLDVIARAPAGIRAAGITDVLSIATGAWDWRFAHEKNKNPAGMEFIPWVHDNALSILSGVLDCAEAAGQGDHGGLKTLFDCLAMEVQLCNQVGHARPEEGSEHYFAYCAETITGPSWPHGDLVGPGILHMASIQGQDTVRYERALHHCQIRLDRIPADVISQILEQLPNYCAKHDLPFGIAHTL